MGGGGGKIGNRDLCQDGGGGLKSVPVLCQDMGHTASIAFRHLRVEGCRKQVLVVWRGAGSNLPGQSQSCRVCQKY